MHTSTIVFLLIKKDFKSFSFKEPLHIFFPYSLKLTLYPTFLNKAAVNDTTAAALLKFLHKMKPIYIC